jgi:ABC-type antimicrobial peptide transport system permease subunit
MDDVVSEALASPRFSSIVLIAFSLAALFLAAIGIYGVISYATSVRIREIGVRMALGARPADAMTLVVRHALRLALSGVAIGVIASLAFTRFLSSLLFGVRPTDPLTLAAVSAFLIAVAVMAGGVPAWRASRVDPLDALRSE